MEGPLLSPRCLRLFVAPICTASLLLVVAGWSAFARADENVYRNGFDDAEPTWFMHSRPSGVNVHRHRRIGNDVQSGAGAELVVMLSSQPAARVQLSHELPESLAFDELVGSLWVKCNHGGLRIGLQVRFPDQIDPRSGKPLVDVIAGDTYTNRGDWQQLRCRTTESALRELVRRLRHELRGDSGYATIDYRTVIVERIVVQVEAPNGFTTLALDDLEFGPIVPPTKPAAKGWWQQREPLERQIRASIGDDQLLIDGQPRILRFAPYHGEEIDELARMGLNVAWIDRYDNTALLNSLQSVGMFAMANPLLREIPLEEAVQPVGLMAFSEQTSPIAFWNMGARLSPEHLQIQEEWMRKVREADVRFDRPILVDVMGAERQYHRHADMIGVSRHPLNTSAQPRDYLDFLRRKKKRALPDRPMFTLIQTEPSDANLVTRTADQSVPVIEPEQIWMQGYAALAAGYKGIGFWKLTSLTSSAPGNDERRGAISLFNAHVQMLEEWLASAKFIQMVPATVTSSQAERQGRARGRFGWREKILPGNRSRPVDRAGDSSEVQVAVFNCDQGLLLLPVWYGTNAQFQPGPMAAEELSFMVSIGRQNVQAWEVTTTSVTPLPNSIEYPAGGSLIRLTNFDQFAAIVLTQGKGPIQELTQRAISLQAACAREWIDLAAAKTGRVEAVHKELTAYAAIPHADDMLRNAQRLIASAEQDFARSHFDGARQKCRRALLLTRIVQRRHWDRAMNDAELTSGVSSPHTICFQTLPDHWQLVSQIGKSSHRDENLLRSGDFEDDETMSVHGWRHEQGSDRRVAPRAELFGVGAAQGRRSLRLVAAPVEPSRPPEDVTDPPERLISPPVSVYAGQIVHISGKVHLASPVTANPDGLVLYESTKGPVGALRWSEPTPRWQSFQLIREIDHSQDLTITIELRGLGDVRIDDLKVIALDPS